jgi:hypothetical protein
MSQAGDRRATVQSIAVHPEWVIIRADTPRRRSHRWSFTTRPESPARPPAARGSASG